MSASAIRLVYASTRAEWRAWLNANHATATGISLVYFKKSSGKPSVTYAEAVEEALCFGWIDSRLNSIDAVSYKQIFTPRKPKSGWSKLNKSRVERLISEGRMTAAGTAKIDLAKKNGSWSLLDASENLEIPQDFESALKEQDAGNKRVNQYILAIYLNCL